MRIMTSVDIRAGATIEYRESVLLPYITIDLSVIDSLLASKDGSWTLGILESIKLQGTEKFHKLRIEDKIWKSN